MIKPFLLLLLLEVPPVEELVEEVVLVGVELLGVEDDGLLLLAAAFHSAVKVMFAVTGVAKS